MQDVEAVGPQPLEAQSSWRRASSALRAESFVARVDMPSPRAQRLRSDLALAVPWSGGSMRCPQGEGAGRPPGIAPRPGT